MTELIAPGAPGQGPDVEDVRRAVEERPDELALAVSELSGLLLDEEDVDTTLQRIADLARRTIPGCDAAGVTLLDEQGSPRTAAYTDEQVLLVDRVQYDAGDGPCLDAARGLRVNRIDLGAADERWPAFTARAKAAGIRSFLAAPLVVRQQGIGALNLYSRSPNGFHELDETFLGLFVGQASICLANAGLYRSALRLTEQLTAALASRAVIEQAKGVLMARHRLSEDAAFAALREQSQRRNVKLREVAQEVVDGVQ